MNFFWSRTLNIKRQQTKSCRCVYSKCRSWYSHVKHSHTEESQFVCGLFEANGASIARH